jgi:hypothetical protein
LPVGIRFTIPLTNERRQPGDEIALRNKGWRIRRTGQMPAAVDPVFASAGPDQWRSDGTISARRRYGR